MAYTQPPLARYEHKLLGFVHELTPLVLDEKEKQLFLAFQEGHRTGLGMSATTLEGLMHCIYLSGVVMAWKTLCFPNQLTGVYGMNKARGATWINGFSHFIDHCDPILRGIFQFAVAEPKVTLIGDDFWRMAAFQPTESDMEVARPHLTNIIYFDFDHVPAWLVADTQQTVKHRKLPITFSITLDRALRDRHTTEPNGRFWTPDGSTDPD